MNNTHKHRDVIIAWANGEEIQFKWHDEWHDWDERDSPAFYEESEYRIKPKRVKKEGWVNVYPGNFLCYFYNKKHADASNEIEKHKRVACIRIEWEEEV